MNTIDKRQLMTISKASWHGRIYLWWKRTGHFKNSSHYTENLCHYVRVVVLWTPMWVLGKTVTAHSRRAKWLQPWELVVLAATGWLIKWGLDNNPAKTHAIIYFTLGFILGGIGLMVLVILGATVMDRYHARKHRRNRADYVQRDPSFVKVLWSWSAAKKHRVCPLIKVNGDHGEQT